MAYEEMKNEKRLGYDRTLAIATAESYGKAKAPRLFRIPVFPAKN